MGNAVDVVRRRIRTNWVSMIPSGIWFVKMASIAKKLLGGDKIRRGRGGRGNKHLALTWTRFTKAN